MARITHYILMFAALCGGAVAGAVYVAAENAAPASQGALLSAPVVLAPHRAIYTFHMVAVEQGSGLAGVDGQMYFENDDVCDAWTTEHRFNLRYHYPERRAVTNNHLYVSWEAKDGTRFQFNSTRAEDGVAVEQLRGGVDRAADTSGTARYSRPDEKEYALKQGFMLPAAHTLALINAARAGERFLSALVFDGTDQEGPVEVNAFIGAPLTPAAIADLRKKVTPDRNKPETDISGGRLTAGTDDVLLTGRAWPVRLAFFPYFDRETMTPAYEMDLVLHDNGVVSDAVVDYKVFKMAQRLTAIEKIPPRRCGTAEDAE